MQIFIYEFDFFVVMKRKKPSFEELERMLDKIHNDPELMKAARKFVAKLGSNA